MITITQKIKCKKRLSSILAYLFILSGFGSIPGLFMLEELMRKPLLSMPSILMSMYIAAVLTIWLKFLIWGIRNRKNLPL